MDAKKIVDLCLAECFRKIEQLNNDIYVLERYFQGVFIEVAKLNNANYRPSHVVTLLLKTSTVDEATSLQYMSAREYIVIFIQNQCDELDKIFEQSYQDCLNIEQAWQVFGNYFIENILKKMMDDIVHAISQEGIQQLIQSADNDDSQR